MPIEPSVLLDAIKAGGKKGISLSTLEKKFCSRKDRGKKSELVVVLKDLSEKRHLAGPVKKGRTLQYFEISFAPVPVKAVMNQLIQDSGTKLYSESKLIKECKGYTESQKKDAIRELIADGAIMKVKCGRPSYLLHRAVASEFFKFPDSEKPVATPVPAITPEAVLPVYERLKSEQRGIETVLIYDLLKALNVPKQALHDLIRREAKMGRATFHTAAAATLSPVVLDAGIRLGGESHPYVSVVFRSHP